MLRIFSVFTMLLFLAANISIAEEVDDGDYIELESGEEAPYAGFLFDRDALAELVARQQREKEELILEKETEVKKVKINLEAEVAKKQVEIDISKDLNEKLLKANKEELQLVKNKLDKLSWTGPTLFVAGVTTGAILTVSLLKIALQIIK